MQFTSPDRRNDVNTVATAGSSPTLPRQNCRDSAARFRQIPAMSSTPAIIDLRSDTLTLPTPALREAMASAAVGDDVFGEDPTVRRLEERTAEMLGKEAALLTVSGTMANQLAVRAHTEPGDEILVEAEAHVYFYEGGGPAAFSGVSCRLLAGERGVFTAEQVERALRPADDHFPRPRLVCVENTHNRGGGRVWPRETLRDVAGAARQRGLKLHLDGARLWNAAIATGQSPRALTAEFDSVSVCFSKGLGAPVGSALAGTGEAGEPEKAYRAAYALAFIDNSWGRDMIAALVAGLAVALVTPTDPKAPAAAWERIKMRFFAVFGGIA
jgi:hypothetical protein